MYQSSAPMLSNFAIIAIMADPSQNLANEYNDLISSQGVRYLPIKLDINVLIITISTVSLLE